MGNIFKLFLCMLVVLALLGFWQYFTKVDCNKILESTYSNSSLNTFEKNKFKDLLSTRYPNFDEMFSQAAIENEIEKNLLAAISFQESQWDPKAKSNMGVRGMMMVTLETAALVGVEKRLNPEQNINGGAKYFSMLQQKNKIGLKFLGLPILSQHLGPWLIWYEEIFKVFLIPIY